MDSQVPKQISIFTKINLVANVVLFAVIGVIYLMEDRNLIAIVLFGASLINIIWALFAIPVRNILFAILNFVYSVFAIAIGVDFQLTDNPYFAMIWFALGLIYIIIAFVTLLKKKTNKKIKTVSGVKSDNSEKLTLLNDFQDNKPII